MSEFMQQCDQKGKFIQVTIYTNAVIGKMCSVAVIAQYAFPFSRYREMYFVKLQILQHRLIGPGRKKSLQMINGRFLFRHFSFPSGSL